MPCFTPLKAWASINQKNPKSGKRIIRFRECEFIGGTEPILVQCGSCSGCRLERARQWSIRCWHEASLREENTFITLTFAPKHLAPDGSLHKEDFQLFMKRLRKMATTDRKFKKASRKKFGKDFTNIRYFHCGEYGEKLGRPHHHACLFNFQFPDQEFIRFSKTGFPCYTSKFLSQLWTFGIHEIGEVTQKSAAYVARYILKKRKLSESYNHYQGKNPEYNTMSRRPGIAHDWYKKFQSDVYPGDFVAMDGGYKSRPPRYYDRQYELTNPEDFALLKQSRVDRAKADPNNTPERLAVRRDIQERKLPQLKRNYENET